MPLHFHFGFGVNVAEVSEERLALLVLGAEGSAVTIDPREAVFRYQDPRESDESVRGNFGATVVCALSVLLRDGTNFVLYEWRSGDEKE